EVLDSDQLSGAVPVLVSTKLIAAGLAGSERCATAVKPADGVICSASGGLGSATCMTTTAAEQPQSPGTLVPNGVFHFCQARLLVLRTLQAAFALVVSHGPKAAHRFCSLAKCAIQRAKMPLNPERSVPELYSGK